MAVVLSPVIVSVNGSPVVLLPGDVVPDGVRVSAPGVVSEPAPSIVAGDPPKGNASRAVWAAYAESVGVDPGTLTRNQIKEAVNGIRDR